MKYLLILVPIAFLLLLSGCDEDNPVAAEENQALEIQSITYCQDNAVLVEGCKGF